MVVASKSQVSQPYRRMGTIHVSKMLWPERGIRLPWKAPMLPKVVWGPVVSSLLSLSISVYCCSGKNQWQFSSTVHNGHAQSHLQEFPPHLTCIFCRRCSKMSQNSVHLVQYWFYRYTHIQVRGQFGLDKVGACICGNHVYRSSVLKSGHAPACIICVGYCWIYCVGRRIYKDSARHV